MIARHVIVAATAAAFPAGQARADALQNQVLAAARATHSDDHAFRRTIVIERTGEPRRTFVEQFDPRRAAAARWSLVSVDGRAPTAREAEDFAKAKRGPTPSYAELAKWFAAPATRVDSAPGTVTYRFARLPKGTMQVGSHDASADTQAEAVVNTKGKQPFVERVRMTSAKKFRMMLVASVDSIVATASYTLLPEGKVVPATSASTLAGALMGKSGEMRTSVTYADFRTVR